MVTWDKYTIKRGVISYMVEVIDMYSILINIESVTGLIEKSYSKKY